MNQNYNSTELRRQCKQKARQALSKNKSGAMLACFIAMLPGLILSIWANYDSFMQTLHTFQTDITTSLNDAGTGLGLTMLVIAFSVLFIMPISMGLKEYFVKISRGEQKPPLDTVLSRFHSFEQYRGSVKIAMSVYIFSALWTVIATMALTMMLFIFLQLDFALDGSMAGAIVIMILYLIATSIIMLLLSIKIYTYDAAFLFGIDYPSITGFNALSAAKDIFKGRYKELLVFCLSFVLWYLPAIIPVCLLSTFLTLVFMGTTSMGLLIGAAISLIAYSIYALYLQSYMELSYINLVTEYRIMNGDTPWIKQEEANGDVQ